MIIDAISGVGGGGGTTIVQKPTVSVGTYTYDGTAQGPTITGFDSSKMIISGDIATNAGSYTLTIGLKNTNSMVWNDMTTADLTWSWSIGKATPTITLSKNSVSLDSNTTSDTVTVTKSDADAGAVTAVSSDTSVATVSISGNTVTINSVNDTSGTATITISTEANTNYNAATSATVSVTATFLPAIVVGNTYKLGSGAHTAGTADLECVVLDIDGTNALCISRGIYAAEWLGSGELTSVKSTYFGDLASAVSGLYLPRGNADGSTVSTNPTNMYVYNGTSWIDTYDVYVKNAITYAAIHSLSYGETSYVDKGWTGTERSDYAGAEAYTDAGNWYDAWKVSKLMIVPSFILDLTKVKLHGNLIVDKNASNPPTKVSFASATPAQREAIVRAYEAGIIDITEYWSDGEEATATLPAIAASGTGWTVGEAQPSQEITLVLSLDNCKELVTVEDNGQKNTKFLYHQKNGLEEKGYMNSTSTKAGSWEGCARRGWCNNGYKAAMIQAFGDIFHELKNITAETYNGTTNQTSNDYFALPAAAEVFKGDDTYGQGGTAGAQTGFSNLTEFNALTRFKYYETTANRVKKQGNSGSATSWFERSVVSAAAIGDFCFVASAGTTNTDYANDNLIIAPFGGV